MKNVMTFDVEDYFHVQAFADRVDKREWANFPSRVEANTRRILEHLHLANRSGTFFVLGWVARKFPALIRSIADAGHEVACHSLEHRCVFKMTPGEFRDDTLKAKAAIEDACGQRIIGYRAPSFSITFDSKWALEILVELGFEYDSSIFPVKHPNYGMPKVPRFPFAIRTNAGTLVEFPLSTVQFGGLRSPLTGGAYMRILPYWYLRWGFGYLNQTEGEPVCIYLHPWELDSSQPRMRSSFTSRLRHYIGLRQVERKLTHLLRDFDFQSMGAAIDDIQRRLPVIPLAEIQ
jgi:polysaccharide deacetylase family protein (PEP-CTERM system associated)